jgi:hypothetical protein
MLARSFNLLLVATILACPFVCRSGMAAGTGSSCCCHERQHGPSETPGPSENGSRSSHQCICSGAVFENASFDVTPTDVSWLGVLLTVEPVTVEVQSALTSEFLTAPPPGGSMNTGRALCCLYSTYQC